MQEYTEQVEPGIESIRDAVEALDRAIEASKSKPSEAAEAEVLGEMEDSLRALRAARDVLMDGRPPTPSLSRLHVDLLGSVIDALESGSLCILNTRRLYEQSTIGRADRARSARYTTRWLTDMRGILRAGRAWWAEYGWQMGKDGLPQPERLTK
jgi:hypothetical protein